MDEFLLDNAILAFLSLHPEQQWRKRIFSKGTLRVFMGVFPDVGKDPRSFIS